MLSEALLIHATESLRKPFKATLTWMIWNKVIVITPARTISPETNKDEILPKNHFIKKLHTHQKKTPFKSRSITLRLTDESLGQQDYTPTSHIAQHS